MRESRGEARGFQFPPVALGKLEQGWGDGQEWWWEWKVEGNNIVAGGPMGEG